MTTDTRKEAPTVRQAMGLANSYAAAWARDEMMENPRTFKAPAAEDKLRAYLEEAFAATSSMQEECARLRSALETIERASGGSRDYMRAVARAALSGESK